MPIIAKVGRRRPGMRLLIAAIYFAVVGGAVVAVYPYWLMVVSGATTQVDYAQWRLIPSYLFDDHALLRDYVSESYSGSVRADAADTSPLDELSRRWRVDVFDFIDAPVDGLAPPTAADRELAAAWDDFLASLPTYCFDVTGRGARMVRLVRGPADVENRQFLIERYCSDVQLMNAAYAGEYTDFISGVIGSSPLLLEEALLRDDWEVTLSLRWVDWYAFKATRPPAQRQPVYGEPDYARHLLRAAGTDIYGDIALVNERYGSSYSSYHEIRMPRFAPEDEPEREDWVEFVRQRWPGRYIRVHGGRESYIEFLKGEYGDLPAVNAAYGTHFASWDAPDLYPATYPAWLPDDLAERGWGGVLGSKAQIESLRAAVEAALGPGRLRAREWSAFVKTLPPGEIELSDSSHRWPDFLRERYGDVAALERETGLALSSFDDARPPFRLAEWVRVCKGSRHYRAHYLTRNFVAVVRFAAFRGRALLNTGVLVVLTIVTHLTVSPLCGYVLSRFRLRYTYKVLLFLIATMAFPAAVGSIPSFLLLRKLRLFNTYAALVLPGLANGFGIFILKSFFDSLPEELFEAARMDGAGELRMFWHIAVPLTRPIFAVNALSSFMSAYGSFMWAFLVCRDPRLWTLMVYLFQLQMRSGSPPLMMASLTVASIPALIMFITCQKVIMRGVILPSFK